MMDWRIIETSNGEYDLSFDGVDMETVTRSESVRNGIILSIMTRLGEVKTPTYSDYGCQVHEVVKAPFNNLSQYKVKQYTYLVLQNMKRIKKINKCDVTVKGDNKYLISFEVETIFGDIIKGVLDV